MKRKPDDIRQELEEYQNKEKRLESNLEGVRRYIRILKEELEEVEGKGWKSTLR